jgi:hypothetical protein
MSACWRRDKDRAADLLTDVASTIEPRFRQNLRIGRNGIIINFYLFILRDRNKLPQF